MPDLPPGMVTTPEALLAAGPHYRPCRLLRELDVAGWPVPVRLYPFQEQ